MKKNLVVLAAMAFVIAMVSGAFAATTTQNVTATASVTGICANGTNGTLAFGPIDPSLPGPVNATGASLAYKCTKGTTFKVSNLAGANGGSTVCGASGACSMVGTMKSIGTPADTLGYTISITSVGAPYVGTGFSAAVVVPFTGSVTQAQYQDVVAHADYSELVTVTITY